MRTYGENRERRDQRGVGGSFSTPAEMSNDRCSSVQITYIIIRCNIMVCIKMFNLRFSNYTSGETT